MYLKIEDSFKIYHCALSKSLFQVIRKEVDIDGDDLVSSIYHFLKLVF